MDGAVQLGEYGCGVACFGLLRNRPCLTRLRGRAQRRYRGLVLRQRRRVTPRDGLQESLDLGVPALVLTGGARKQALHGRLDVLIL